MITSQFFLFLVEHIDITLSWYRCCHTHLCCACELRSLILNDLIKISIQNHFLLYSFASDIKKFMKNKHWNTRVRILVSNVTERRAATSTAKKLKYGYFSMHFAKFFIAIIEWNAYWLLLPPALPKEIFGNEGKNSFLEMRGRILRSVFRKTFNLTYLAGLKILLWSSIKSFYPWNTLGTI